MVPRDSVEPPAFFGLSAASPWSEGRLSSYLRGLVVTELFDDVRQGQAYTLLAPISEAFDALPCPFERFLGDPSLAEIRADIFEYTVVRGHHRAEDFVRGCRTLQGESLDVVRGRVIGRVGAANVIATLEHGPLLVHLTDRVIHPHALYDSSLVRPLRLLP